MIVTDVINDVVHQVPSMSQAVTMIYGNKRGFDKIIPAFIIPRKPITIRGGTWLLEYANPVHHANAVAKYSKRKSS